MLSRLRQDIRAQLESRNALCHVVWEGGQHALVARFRRMERNWVVYYCFGERGDTLEELNGSEFYPLANTIDLIINRLAGSLSDENLPYSLTTDGTQEALDAFLSKHSGLTYYPRK